MNVKIVENNSKNIYKIINSINKAEINKKIKVVDIVDDEYSEYGDGVFSFVGKNITNIEEAYGKAQDFLIVYKEIPFDIFKELEQRTRILTLVIDRKNSKLIKQIKPLVINC